MAEFLKTLLFLSVAGTLCGLMLAALRRVFKRKIPSSFLYVAWIVVVLRFALPVNGLVPIGNEHKTSETQSPVYTEYQQPLNADTQNIISSSEATEPELSVQQYTPHSPVENPQITDETEYETETVHKPFPLVEAILLAWGCGAVVFLLCKVIPYIRFTSSLNKRLIRPLSSDVRIYDEVCPSKKPKLARSRMISAPLTFGLFRPVLVIPDREYDAAALKCIFAHEIIHYKRCDIPIKWIVMIVFSAHWFNPFTWFFRKEIDEVCELSCDEKLLKEMNADEKHDYGETLLSIAENAEITQSQMVTGFSKGKKELKERLLQIMQFKKKGKTAIILALIPVLLLCGCAVALGPKAAELSVSGEGTVQVSNVDELLAAIAPNAEIHLAAGTYNLTEAASYGKDGASEYYHWNSYGFENQYELCIEDVDNLIIIGDKAEILTVPRSSNVLAFRNCDQLSLRGLTVGHTEAAQACEGGVILLEGCVDTIIDSCRLYGCGTIGVCAERSRDLMVSGTEIYHCSGAGISFSEGRGLSVYDCDIYDCGRSGKYQDAAAAFILYDSPDVRVSNCDIYDNYLQNLIQGNAKSYFENIRICDNHIAAAFCYDGDIQFTNVSLSGNTVDKWFNDYWTGTIIIDRKEVTEDELTAMWGEQMSSAGIGSVEVDNKPIDRTGTKEVHIKTADEFLSAIASDTTVYIDAPQIDLTVASNYGEGAAEEWLMPEFGDKAYAWVYCYDGYELFIGNVSNFHIVGGEIVTQPRYANVLNYLNCSKVTLDGVHLGHTPEQGVCRGGVLNLQDSDSVILEGCDLYGCGILGFQAQNVQNLHVQNTLIHDCSNGAAMLQDSNNIVFLGCDVVNCPNPHFFLAGCENFSWDGKLMDPHSSFNVNDDARNPYEEVLNSAATVPSPMPETGKE